MTRSIFLLAVGLLGCADVVSARFDEAHPLDPVPKEHPVWSLTLGDEKDQYGKDAALLSDGGVVVVGSFNGTLPIPGHLPLASVGDEDIFVLALDATGVVQWARSFGGPGRDAANSVAVTPDGDIVVVGTYMGPIEFGTSALENHGDLDMYVTKLASNGQPLWSFGYGGNFPQFAYAVAVSETGYIAVAGGFRGTMQLSETRTLSASLGYGTEDAYVALFDEKGSLEWAYAYESSNRQVVSGLKFRDNHLFVSGTFAHAIDFDGLTLEAEPSASFVADLDRSTGKPRWARFLGLADAYQFADVVGVLSDDSVAIAVGLARASEEDPDLLQKNAEDNNRVFNDVLVERLDPDTGNPIWSRAFDAELESQIPSALTVWPNDDISIVGKNYGTVDFGLETFQSEGVRDGFLARFAKDGTTLTTFAMTGPEEQLPDSVVVGDSGRLYVVGSSQGASDWGSVILSGAGGYDVVIAAYDR